MSDIKDGIAGFRWRKPPPGPGVELKKMQRPPLTKGMENLLLASLENVASVTRKAFDMSWGEIHARIAHFEEARRDLIEAVQRYGKEHEKNGRNENE